MTKPTEYKCIMYRHSTVSNISGILENKIMLLYAVIDGLLILPPFKLPIIKAIKVQFIVNCDSWLGIDVNRQVRTDDRTQLTLPVSGMEIGKGSGATIRKLPVLFCVVKLGLIQSSFYVSNETWTVSVLSCIQWNLVRFEKWFVSDQLSASRRPLSLSHGEHDVAISGRSFRVNHRACGPFVTCWSFFRLGLWIVGNYRRR